MKIPFISQYLDQIHTRKIVEWEQYQQKLAIEQERLKKLERQQQWRKVIAAHLSNDAAEIDICYCPPGNIPDDIEFPATIRSLSLNHSSLTALPQSIYNLTELTKLKIFDSHLQTLPEEIGNLGNLTGLIVRNSYLEYLPENIGRLTNLLYLDLQVNRLTAIPQSIANLQNLIEIDLWNNPITDLSIIDQLPNLSRYCRQSLHFHTVASYIDKLQIKHIQL